MGDSWGWKEAVFNKYNPVNVALSSTTSLENGHFVLFGKNKIKMAQLK